MAPQIGELMQTASRLRHVVLGIAIGGIATMAFGFTQGGWLLGSSAERLADHRSITAVTKALVPICISQARADPKENAKLERLSELETSYARQSFVIETGWATMPMADTPNREVAAACAEVLKAEQLG
jgi:hypothetical protein